MYISIFFIFYAPTHFVSPNMFCKLCWVASSTRPQQLFGEP